MEPIDESRIEHVETPQPSKGRGFIVFFAIAMFFVFLLFKLPEAKIQNVVIAHIRIFAQDQGISFSAEKVRIGLLFGPSIKFTNVELKALEDDRLSMKIPYLKISPKLLSLPFSMKKAAIKAELLDGEIDGTIGASTAGAIHVDLDLDKLNLNSATLLRHFLQIQLAGILGGTLRIDLDPASATASNGKLRLKLDKVSLPAQSVFGFNLPEIKMAAGAVDGDLDAGKFTIKDVSLGSNIKADDLVLHVTGDASLEPVMGRSKLNMKAVFELSQKVLQSFPLLEALLQPARSSDGKYTYRLQGQVMTLEPQPGG